MTTSTWDMYDTYEALKEAENGTTGIYAQVYCIPTMHM